MKYDFRARAADEMQMTTEYREGAMASGRPWWRRWCGNVKARVQQNRVGSALLVATAIVFSNILIALRLDSVYVRQRNRWKWLSYDEEKSPQENVGFSHRSDVEAALQCIHGKLRELAEAELPAGARVLDIGSGTGLVAGQLVDRWDVVGLDVSPALTEVARRLVPQATFLCGDITSAGLEPNFALVYSISVLEYLPPNELAAFMARVAELLTPSGLFFLQYPHPVKYVQLWHPNLLYTFHQPRTVDRTAQKYFDTVLHHHSFDFGKVVERVDPDPYPLDTIANGYLYVGRKKCQRSN